MCLPNLIGNRDLMLCMSIQTSSSSYYCSYIFHANLQYLHLHHLICSSRLISQPHLLFRKKWLTHFAHPAQKKYKNAKSLLRKKSQTTKPYNTIKRNWYSRTKKEEIILSHCSLLPSVEYDKPITEKLDKTKIIRL